MPHLRRFYAVTTSGSLYAVEVNGLYGRPGMRKLNPRLDELQMVDDGNVVKLFANGLVSGFRASGSAREDVVHVNQTKTTPVVALFQNEEEARDCLHLRDLECLDERWKVQTRGTLAAIGAVHPDFIIAQPNTFLYASDDFDRPPKRTGLQRVLSGIARLNPWA